MATWLRTTVELLLGAMLVAAALDPDLAGWSIGAAFVMAAIAAD